MRRFSNAAIIKLLNVYSQCLTCFVPFTDFLFANHQFTSVERYWDVRGYNNYTSVQLCLPFNFTVAPLSDFILFKMLDLYHIPVYVDFTNISSVSG